MVGFDRQQISEALNLGAVFPNILAIFPNIVAVFPNIVAVLANIFCVLSYVLTVLPNGKFERLYTSGEIRTKALDLIVKPVLEGKDGFKCGGDFALYIF